MARKIEEWGMGEDTDLEITDKSHHHYKYKKAKDKWKSMFSTLALQIHNKTITALDLSKTIHFQCVAMNIINTLKVSGTV